MTSPIVQVHSTPNMKLKSCDRSNKVRCMTKTKQGNNVTIHTGVVYAEIEFEPL